MPKLLRILGIAASVLVGLVLVCAALVYRRSNAVINRRYTDIGSTWVSPPVDSAVLARGKHLVEAVAKCGDCHGPDFGGTPFLQAGAFAEIPAPNITRGRGGRTAAYTDQDWARIIQHAVKPDGSGAVIMPAESYVHLGDDDLAAIIAYMKSVPPVDSTWPAPRFGPVGRTLLALGKLPFFAAAYIDHGRTSVLPTPDPAITPEYGRYLTRIGGCEACHNPAYSGGPSAGGPPGSPPAANLTPGGIGEWKEEDFFKVLREGRSPYSGREINDQYMPWRSSGRMTDDEIRAVWTFLRTLPRKEIGER